MASTGVAVLVIGCILHLFSNIHCLEITRLINRHQEETSPYQRLMHHQAILNQRSTQFLPSQPSANSRGALILPANNQIQANNFNINSLNHPVSRYQVQSSAQFASILPSTTTATTTTTAAQTTIAKSSRLPTVSNFSLSVDQQPLTNTRGNFLQAGTIELALRQTSSDENVFQPSPTHDFNWLAHSTSPTQQQQTPNDPQVVNGEPEHGAGLLQVPYQSSILSTTTEQSNNIVQSEPIVSVVHQQENQLNQQHQLQYGQQKFSDHQSEYPSTLAGNITGADLKNHFNYENSSPITISSSDYYFSSAERLPNNEKASNAWWAIGFGHDFERASNLTRDDYLDYCLRSELLVSSKQRMLCKTHHRIMPIVARGLKTAIEECQLRFTNSRWNCTLVLHDSLNNNNNYQDNNHLIGERVKLSSGQLFGDVMKQPNRERSFLNAIFAAGLAHAMTKACSQGELPEECSCDKRIKSKNRGKIEWVACSDDIDYGAKFSRDFTDSTADANESDVISMINGHNYEVGRRVFKSSTDITCTCFNDDSNSLCQTKRCWKHLGPFSDIGDELMRRYESATHMQLSSKDPHKLRPVRRGVRKPKRKDLVYIDESPDYCSPDSRLGVIGTQNRHCNSTSSGPDSCSLLCCGRGHQVVVENIEEDCNCKFVWCCQVKCDRCKRQITNDVCN